MEGMNVFPEPMRTLAEDVLAACRQAKLWLATAESCTGGLIAACLTSVPGSSHVVDRGFVTYTNEAKRDLLGVPEALFTTVGAVSEDVARAMAEGALRRSRAHIGIAVTGIAGPGGATDAKPIGLVHIAAARIGHVTQHERHVFAGDRDAIRMQAAETALRMLKNLASAP
jgi:nicotinamide-nucleotide amidase